MMNFRRTIAAVGIAVAALVAGLAVPASAAPVSHTATAHALSTAAVLDCVDGNCECLCV